MFEKLETNEPPNDNKVWGTIVPSQLTEVVYGPSAHLASWWAKMNLMYFVCQNATIPQT